MKKCLTIAVFIWLSAGTLPAADALSGLEADLNGDGIVNMLDLGALAGQWLQTEHSQVNDLMQDAAFERNSVAFLDGKRYVADAPRRRLIAVSGVSDLVIHGEAEVVGAGSIILAPKCTAGGYIYATETDHSNIYRSSDGITWEQTTDSLTGAYRMFGTHTGAIIVAKIVDGQMNLFRSETGGSDLADGSLPTASLTLPAQGSYMATVGLWNFHQAKTGTICMGEYGNPGWPGFERSRIYRSVDDGVTFAEVYDDPDGVKHSHRVIKHEATGRWVSVYGDGSHVNKVVKSDDDGIIWSTLDPQLDSQFQPVEFYDYGHPTNLLYGSDARAFVGTFDVMTAEVTPLYSDGDRSFPMVFSIGYHDGVFYAGTYSSAYSGERRTAILASADLVHWAVYHQFRDAEQVVNKFLGIFDGKIHGIVTMADKLTWRHFSFTPTTVNTVNGLCLDPAATNVLDDEQLSSVEDDTSGWSAVTGAVTRVTTDAVHGQASLRVQGVSGADTVYTKSRPVTVGKTYSGRVFLKGNMHNQSGYLNWYVYGSSRKGPYHFFHLSQDDWTEIVLDPITILSNETAVSIHIRPRGKASFHGPYDMLVDAAQYEEVPPTRWQVGGITREDEMLSKVIETSGEWTEEIRWAPECRSEWYANSGNQYIKSWCADEDNYVELYFDPSDSTFALQATGAGVPQVAIKTSPYLFYRNSVIRFIVRCEEDSLSLSVSAAGPYEHISGPGVDFMTSRTLTSKTGNHDGVGLMSCTLLSDVMYDY